MSATTGLVEDALQHGLATSEEDAEYEEDDMVDDLMAENENAVAANYQLQNGLNGNNDEVASEDDDLSTEHEQAMLTDAEGEDEDMPDSPAIIEEGSEDEEEEEDGEGVGAVKINPKPGIVEEDEEVLSATDEEDDESVASMDDEDDDDESKGSSDAELEAEWKSAGEEEEEIANPNRCVFVA